MKTELMEWEWLKNGEGVMKIKTGGGAYFYMKVPYNEQFDYIFAQRNYRGENIMADKFEYAGIYGKTAGRIYDAQYCMSALTEFLRDTPVESGHDYDAFEEQFYMEVNAKINAMIKNDRSILSIKSESEITDFFCKRDLESAREYRETDRVRQLFLAGKTADDIVFNPCYSGTGYAKENFPRNFSYDDYIGYMTNKSMMITGYATDWIAANQEYMLTKFLINDIIREELRKIAGDKTHELHAIKGIMDGFNRIECKTVNVTVSINGVECVFKTEASQFYRDCHRHYWGHNIVAADRAKFEALFGRNSNYGPLDIIRITYGKKTLYERGEYA